MPNPPSGDRHGNVFRFPGDERPVAEVASGGGGPHGPDLDARMTRLEEQYSRIETLLRGVDDRLRKVETDIAELKGRVANLPSTWAMVTTMLGGQITLAGFLIAIIRIVGGH